MYVGVSTCRGVCNSRIAKSIDGGLNWTESDVLFKAGDCCSIVRTVSVDPQNSDIVYAGTGDLDGGGSGIWKSSDGGMRWENLDVHGGIEVLAIDPANTTTVYASSVFLWKSGDAGGTWAVANATPGVCGGTLAIDRQNTSQLYCSGWASSDNKGYAVVRSSDAGVSWTAMGAEFPGFVTFLLVDPRDSATVYAATSSGLFSFRLL